MKTKRNFNRGMKLGKNDRLVTCKFAPVNKKLTKVFYGIIELDDKSVLTDEEFISLGQAKRYFEDVAKKMGGKLGIVKAYSNQ